LPPEEAVNLSYFAVPDMSQIKDLRPPETPKVEKIHILVETVNHSDFGRRLDNGDLSRRTQQWVRRMR